MNARIYRLIGLTVPSITALALLFIDPGENLFSTGITPKILLIIFNIFLWWAILKNKV